MTSDPVMGEYYDGYTAGRFRKVADSVAKLVGQRDRVAADLTEAEGNVERHTRRHGDATKARAVIQQVAQETQRQLEYHLGNLVSLAEAAVFPDPYEFRVRFEQRRGKTECDLLFVKGDSEMDPMTSSGGGPLDVAAFALRCAYWALRKTRPVIILDEPFRFVSVDMQARCSEMLKMVSSELGVQVLMTSHLPNIIEAGDKLFRCEMRDGVSYVEEM